MVYHTTQTTWDKPDVEEMKKTPPPPPPGTPPKIEKGEHDMWFKIDDGKGRKMWFNEKTRETQYGVPECRKKYR